LALDPLAFFKARIPSPNTAASQQSPLVDFSRFSVTFQGKTCLLGNTLPFRFLARLARRPNCYVSYEELLADVWQGTRSESSIRSVVKVLRRRLRQDGLADLAEAIDGTAAGHYALKVKP